MGTPKLFIFTVTFYVLIMILTNLLINYIPDGTEIIANYDVTCFRIGATCDFVTYTNEQNAPDDFITKIRSGVFGIFNEFFNLASYIPIVQYFTPIWRLTFIGITTGGLPAPLIMLISLIYIFLVYSLIDLFWL